MTQYQKYLFDDFVVSEKQASSDISGLEMSEQGNENVDIKADEETTEILEDPEVMESDESRVEQDISSELPEERMYSQDELDEAVKSASDEAWIKGKEAALEDELNKQNELLMEIKNQLSVIFAGLQEQTLGMEEDGLKFFAACLRKVLPTVDSTTALPEVKNFLQDNFANLRNNKSLAFYFAPDMAKSAAPLIEKIAEQNDFEGKISVHKDENLTLSDCRIEWKDGYVERDVNKLLEKIDQLLANNQ